MRILVIEDEEALREQLAERLRGAGYAVDLAATGVDGEHIGLEYPLDAAIVDLGLPDRPGGAVIKAWRERGRAFPILILTARGRWEDKVAGLELGADDYLVKPFHSEELLARLRALLRRAAGFSHSRIRCGPVDLDLGAKRVSVAGRELDLTALEFKVLECLMMRAGTVLAKANSPNTSTKKTRNATTTCSKSSSGACVETRSGRDCIPSKPCADRAIASACHVRKARCSISDWSVRACGLRGDLRRCRR